MSTLTAKLKSDINWLNWLIILLTVSGLGISAYLMWGYTVPGATLSCGGLSGCDTVKDSIYANLLGIPLPVIGMISYLTILILALLHRHFVARQTNGSAYTALAIFGISLTGVLYSAYLTYIELFVIEAICRWCVASAVIMVAIFILSTLSLYSERE